MYTKYDDRKLNITANIGEGHVDDITELTVKIADLVTYLELTTYVMAQRNQENIKSYEMYTGSLQLANIIRTVAVMDIEVPVYYNDEMDLDKWLIIKKTDKSQLN